MGIFDKLFRKRIESAFLNAAKKGDLARIKSLLDNNRELDLDNVKTSIFGLRPLHLAAENDHVQVVEFLLAKGANVNATEREMANTPLHVAAYKGHTQIAELLLSKGADINAQNKNGSTPLYEAVLWGRMRMVEVLIAKGADVNTKDSDGEPVLVLASRALPGRPKPQTDVYGGAPATFDIGLIGDQKHRKEIAELLIAKGADVNTKNIIGMTPLHYTAAAGQREVAELLLTKGADANSQNPPTLETPLYSAADAGQREVAELLLAKGADVDAKTFDSFTPLHAAAQNGHKDVVELLLDKGADANARAKSRIPSLICGATPLWLAKDGGHEEIVELLRNRRAIE